MTELYVDNSCFVSLSEYNPWWAVEFAVPLHVVAIMFHNKGGAGNLPRYRTFARPPNKRDVCLPLPGHTPCPRPANQLSVSLPPSDRLQRLRFICVINAFIHVLLTYLLTWFHRLTVV